MRCSGSLLVNRWSVHGRECAVHAKMCVHMLPLLFDCVRRAAVKAVLLLLPILGLTWLCGVLVPFSTAMAYIFITLSSLQVDAHARTHARSRQRTHVHASGQSRIKNSNLYMLSG